MTSIMHTRLWLSLGLIVVLVACGGAGKPTIKLSASPTTLEDGQEVMLSADAKGAQKVEFYKGSDKVGEDGSAPYELKLALTSGDDATLSFTAKAIAASGQSAVSEAVKVSVKVDKEAPKIGLAASNSNLSAAGAVTLTANATDNKGVVRVEFFKGTEKLGEDITPADGFSLVVNLNAEDNGALKYTAKAHDKKGNIGTSAEVVVSVDIDITPPSISLSSDKTTISAVGSATLSADASDNKGVAKVEFFQGSDKIGEDTEAPFVYSLSFSADDNGTHTYSAKAYDAKDNSATSNSLSINVDIDATKPEVSLASDKTTLTDTGSVLLNATASDNKGVVKVEFFNGSEKLGEDTEAPYTLNLDFSAAHNGTHTYTAKAFDSSDNSSTSNPISISVDIDATAPEVNLAADKTTLTDTGSATLTATAADNKGVVRVEFFKGSDKIAEDTEAPYTLSLSYTDAHNGSHTYTAKAFDKKGNAATSKPITITVDIDIIAPIVSLASDKTTITQPGPALLTATASDNKAVARVEFYEGANKLGEDLEAPFSYEVNFAAAHNGNHSYSVKAFDPSSNSAVSNQVSIAVDIDITAPTVSLSTNTTSMESTGLLFLMAEANDNKGVSKVEFYKNGSKIAEDATGNDGYFFDLSYEQSYQASDSFSARAYDADGNMATSNTVEVVVDIDADLPTVSLSANTAKLTVPGTLTLTATSSDNRSVKLLVFHMNYGNVTSWLNPAVSDPPATVQRNVDINAAHNGKVEFLARVYDAKGNEALSAPKTVVDVEIPPVITSFDASPNSSLNVPASGGTVNLGWAVQNQESYTLEVSPGDATASINAGSKSGKVTVPPNLTSEAKTYTVTLKAKAYGSIGIPDDVRTLTISVANDTTLPTISLSKDPTTTITAAGSVKLKATAWDDVGIQKVEFFKSGVATPIATDTQAPYEHTLNYTTADSGSYTYTARAYDLSGNSNNSAALSVSVDIRGSLAVTINGLPAGTNADVNILGPFGYFQNLSATTTLNNLKPGTYAVSVSAVDGGNYSYAASSSSVEVTAGSTASGTVNYAAFSGALNLSMGGLPIGTAGSVAVTGPNNFSQTLTASTTLKKLLPGTYTITPASVDSGNYSYGAASSSVQVSAGNTAPATVSYALNTAALALTITGLPGGQGVTVTGPNSYSQSLTATTTLVKLAPGSYTIGAPDVSGYTKTITGSPAVLTVGNTASASVVYVATASGTLDTTFGTGGKVATSFGGVGFDIGYSVAVQSDGKIVVAGSVMVNTVTGSFYDFALARYNPDGTLDPGFGSGGKVITNIGFDHDYAYALAIQGDGKIVVAGTSKLNNDYDFSLVRYNPDGSLDTGFGIEGKMTTSLYSSGDTAKAIAIQADGKIVLAGSSAAGGTSDFALVRYTASGWPDPTFGYNGVVYTDFNSSQDGAEAIKIQGDGKLVVAGTRLTQHSDFALARYNSDGSLDTGFGTGGKVTTDFSASSGDKAYALALQSNGQIVLAGTTDVGGGYNFALARYGSDGSLDTSFGAAGKVINDLTPDDIFYALAIQSDGKIVAGGYARVNTVRVLNYYALARYNPNGSLDTGFGSMGITTTAFDTGTTLSSNTANFLAIQSDGKLVAAGVTQRGPTLFLFSLARYNP